MMKDEGRDHKRYPPYSHGFATQARLEHLNEAIRQARAVETLDHRVIQTVVEILARRRARIHHIQSTAPAGTRRRRRFIGLQAGFFSAITRGKFGCLVGRVVQIVLRVVAFFPFVLAFTYHRAAAV